MPHGRFREERRGEAGNVSLFLAVGLVALLGVMALGIDVGLAYTSRAQAQAAADAVALAAAANMVNQDATAVTLTAADAAANDVAGRNFALPVSGLNVDPTDLTYGRWDLDSRTLETSIDLTDPNQVTGAEAILRLDDVTNPSVRPILARVLGIDRFDVQVSATAHLGFAGTMGPGAVDLPVSVPCCELTGSNCDQQYCSSGPPLPNPCPLQDNPQAGIGMVSCLEFHSTGEQTACWTALTDDTPAINTANLVDIVNNSSPTEITVDSSIYVDNGNKVPVVGSISDRFYGDGMFQNNPNGVDRYPPFDGVSDSWIVRLPVVECQDEDVCAGGNAADVRGFVCFEVMEVNVTPDKIIRGRFLCPDQHPDQMDICLDGLGPTGSGGLDFGIRADLPVLVE